MLLAFFKS